MSTLVTLDGGTSNTRATLWRDGVPIREVSAPIGAREAEDMPSTAANLIDRLGVEADHVVGAGMLTSERGIHLVPHLTAPATLEILSEALVEVALPNGRICHLVPGLKNSGEQPQDMMRGEEVETLALYDRMELEGPTVFILMGSHTKIVQVGPGPTILGCLTTLCGELYEALSRYTILKHSLPEDLPDGFDPERLLEGSRLSQTSSLSRAAFAVRIKSRLEGWSPLECASFLLGAVLGEDAQALRSSSLLAEPIVVAGRQPLRSAMALILRDSCSATSIREASEDECRNLAGYGMLLVAQRRWQ